MNDRKDLLPQHVMTMIDDWQNAHHTNSANSMNSTAATMKAYHSSKADDDVHQRNRKQDMQKHKKQSRKTSKKKHKYEHDMDNDKSNGNMNAVRGSKTEKQSFQALQLNA